MYIYIYTIYNNTNNIILYVLEHFAMSLRLFVFHYYICGYYYAMCK